MSEERHPSPGAKDRIALLNILEDLKAENEARKRTEAERREAETRYRLLFELSPDGIVILDPATARPLEFNEAACRQLGYTREEFARLSLSEIDAREPPEEIRRHIDLIRRGGRDDFETLQRTRGGEIRNVHVTARIMEILGVSVYHCIWRDITERKRAEEALQEANETLQAIIQSSPLAIISLDPEGNVTHWNPAAERVFGWSERESLGRFLPLVPDEKRDEHRALRERVLRGEGFSDVQARRRKKDGSPIDISISTAPLRDAQGRIIGIISVNVDITERKRAEEALREKEAQLRFALEGTNDGFWDVDMKSNKVFMSHRGCEILGFSPEEMTERFDVWAKLVHPDDMDATQKALAEHLDGRAPVFSVEQRLMTRSGEWKWILTRGKIVACDANGAPARITGTHTDISERRKAEGAIQASLREKETLLREIHHRVKNNMQVISSLFNLQAGHIADADARRMLKEGQLRIRSMALIHEKLYQARDLSKIEFASYIQSLAAHLFQFFRVDPAQVRLETDLENVSLDINSAVPCGLLINELVSNVLKHAFPGGRKGIVRIRLRREKDGSLELRVADDGVGFPEGLDFRRTGSFGLQIVDLLIEQLEGKIELERKPGTAFTITFRELEYKPRT